MMEKEGATKHVTRASLGYDMSEHGAVMQHIVAYPDTIMMMDTLTTHTVAPLLPAIAACDAAQHRVVICNV